MRCAGALRWASTRTRGKRGGSRGHCARTAGPLTSGGWPSRLLRSPPSTRWPPGWLPPWEEGEHDPRAAGAEKLAGALCSTAPPACSASASQSRRLSFLAARCVAGTLLCDLIRVLSCVPCSELKALCTHLLGGNKIHSNNDEVYPRPHYRPACPGRAAHIAAT